MSNRRVIFWLFVLAVAAITANVFLSLKKPIEGPLQNRTLLAPSFDVTTVMINRPGQQTDTVLAKAGRWGLTVPYVGAADSEVVLRLIDAFAFSKIEDALTESELLKLGRTRDDFGLAEPRLRVSFADATETVEIAFGCSTPTSNGVYAVKSGSPSVVVVPQEVFAAADLKAEAFRERAVFPYEPGFVTGFDLKRPGESVLSFRREDIAWRSSEGVASLPKLRQILSLISDSRARSFVWPVGATNETQVATSAVLSSYGLDTESALTIILRCGDGVDRRILLGHDAGPDETYALIHGGAAVVTIGSELKRAVSQNARSYVDARLFPLEESAVRSFTVTRDETSYILARTEAGGWRLDSPVSAPADAEAVKALLGRILTMTPADLMSGGVKVTVSTNLPMLAVSPSRLLDGRRLDDLRSREILKIDPKLVKRIVTRSGEAKGLHQAVVFARDRQCWNEETDQGIGRPVSVRKVSGVLKALDPLCAAEIVTLKASASDLVRYGLEKPYRTLAIDQDRIGSVRRNILIGDEVRDGRYATVGSAEAVFILPKKTVEVLTAELIGD